jgi:diguanylate cyclase (GGDEF)-like protein/PAS domain S-box-containing protein
MQHSEQIPDWSLMQQYLRASPSIFFYWVAETGWPVEYVSENIIQFGYSPEEFISGVRKFSEIVHPEDLDRVIQEVEEHTANRLKSFAQEYRLLTAEGEVRWVDDRTVTQWSMEGEVTHYLGIITDITNEKTAEIAQKRADLRYRRVEENLHAQHIFYAHNRQGAYTYLSPSIKHVLGFDPDVFLQSDYAERTTDDPLNRKAVDYTRLAREAERQPPYEVEVKDDSGVAHHLEITEWPVFDNHGEVIAVEGVARDITERKNAETRLKVSQEKYRALVETTDDFIWEVDRNGVYAYCSPKVKSLLGYTPEEIVGKTPFDFMTAEDAGMIAGIFTEIRGKKEAFSALENTTVHRDGREIVLETSGVPFFDADGNLAGYRGIDRDITDRKRAQRQLVVQRKFLQSIIDGVRDSIMVINADYSIELMNQVARDSMQPKFVTDMDNPKCHEALHHSHEPCDGEDHLCPLRKVIASGEAVTVVHRHPLPDGASGYLELIASPLRNENGEIPSIIEIARNVTDHVSARHELEKQKLWLQKLAHYDGLTGLPNRLLFLDRLQQAVKKARRTDTQLAILFVDLDRFKQINDSLGHAMGDAVLNAVAGRLVDCFRENDVVARLGGDEFTIILDALHNTRHAATMAQKVIRTIQHPIRHKEHEFYVSASVGISLYPQDGEDADMLLRNADAAMYKAKDEGKNGFQFYTANMTELAFERALMESHLRRALENEQFALYYQPQIDLRTDRLIGVEALLRWQHPELGRLSPAKFITLAEDTGLILPLGEWVLRAACRQVAAWYEAGSHTGRVAVNLAANQLNNDRLLPTIERILEESGCRPEWLEVEITESVIMQRHERSLQTLLRLKSLGIEVVIDDFGTGCSSLSYLKRLPVSKLKIDRSIIRNFPTDTGDNAIARAIIAMGRSLGLRVIAEGVENSQQAAFLSEEGCNEVQGYLYAPPLPADRITEWL